MNFLSSIFFSLIPLISIPLIIHLLNKRNVITINFSSIRFLQALETESIRRLQFLQILLMALRTLIILLIILMMTRPVMGGLFTYWDTENEATTSVILIDDSFSMHGNSNGISRLELIESTYLNILDNISDNSKIHILTLSKGQLYAGLKAKMPKLSKLIQIGFSSPTIDSALKDIESKIAEESGMKELYYITDGQRTQLESALPFSEFLSDWKIFTLIIPPVNNNLSILSADIDNVILLPNAPIKVRVKVSNDGDDRIENKLLQLFVNDISVAQQLITVNGNSISEFEFITAVPSIGDYACHFELDDDERIEDNYFHFKISIPQTLNVGSIGTGNESIYMNSLFESINFKNSIILNKSYSLLDIQQAINDNNSIIILTGYRLLAEAGPDLLEFVGNGGHLIIFPDDSDSLSMNLDIFDPTYKNINLKVLKEDSYQTASLERYKVASNLFPEDFNQSPIKLFKYFAFPKNENSILITNNSHSIYSRYFEGNGMVDIFAISPTLGWSNFPIRGYFIPFFHRILYSQFKQSNSSHAFIDQDWNLPSSLSESYKKLTYFSPSEIDYDVKMNTDFINYEPIPGIHKLISPNGGLIFFTAINIPMEEIDSNFMNSDSLKKYLSPDLSIINIGDGNIRESILDSRVGTELWRLILYLIIFLIIIEMVLSSNAVRKTSS